MKKRVAILLVISTLFLMPCKSFAWGKEGHTIVAEIAFGLLDSTTKQNVQHYLESTTLEQAGNWMDEMRSNPDYDFMKPWHYINIEQGFSYIPSTNDNIINHLIISYNELQHLQTLCDAQIKTDILVLCHLIGDLHQPLHVGYGIDRGGNTVQVNFSGVGTNLHHVWDTDIIENQNISFQDCMNLYANLPQPLIDSIKKIDFISWMNQSRSLLDSVYNFTGHKLGEEYALENKAIVERQLLYAGLRLASVLEQLFKGAYKPESASKANPGVILTITAKEVANHVGELVTVCDKVYGTHVSKSQTTFINIGAKYPESLLTIVIFSKDRSNFKQPPEDFYVNKNICVTGRIKQYQGKNEIIISNPDDIKIQ